MFDKERIEDDLDMKDIIEYLGIETRKKAGLTSVLCPLHDDMNFGSAYISKDNKGVYCYACKKYIKAIDYVLDVENCGFSEALGLIADSGYGRDFYTVKGTNSLPKKNRIKIISAEDRDFIGLNSVDKNVYKPISQNYVLNLSKEERKKTYTEKAYEFGEPTQILYKQIQKLPLQTLAEENYENYTWLVREKALETKNKYIHLRECVSVIPFHKMIGCSVMDLLEAIDRNINRAEEIFFEFGGEKKKEKKIIKLSAI